MHIAQTSPYQIDSEFMRELGDVVCKYCWQDKDMDNDDNHQILVIYCRPNLDWNRFSTSQTTVYILEQ